MSLPVAAHTYFESKEQKVAADCGEESRPGCARIASRARRKKCVPAAVPSNSTSTTLPPFLGSKSSACVLWLSLRKVHTTPLPALGRGGWLGCAGGAGDRQSHSRQWLQCACRSPSPKRARLRKTQLTTPINAHRLQAKFQGLQAPPRRL